MHGLMQDWPLLCHRIIDHAAANHGARRRDLTLRRGSDPHHRLRARSARARSRSPSASNATASSPATGSRRSPGTPGGISNAWYGIVGAGAVYHTVNPRLFPEQIAWIVNHAEDRVMMTDLTFVPLLEKLADKLPTHRALHRAHRCRAHAGDDAAQRRALRGMDRRGRRRFRLEESFDENDRRRHVLHVGHHRQSQGRRLFAPLQRAARDGDVMPRHVRHLVPRRGHAGGADVPRQRLVARALRADGGRRAGDAGAEARRRLDLRAAERSAGVTCTAAVPTIWLMLLQHLETSGGKLPQLQASGDRRLGLPARHDQDIPGGLRRRRHARLGHDRDEPARHAVLDQAGL